MTQIYSSKRNPGIPEPLPESGGSGIFFASKPRIALVASISWTLWNYRLALIKALEDAGCEVLLIAAPDSAQPNLTQHTRAQFIPLRHLRRNSLSPLVNLRLVLEFYRIFRKTRPDTVLLFTIRPNMMGNFSAAACGIPTISTVEGVGIAGSGKTWLRLLMQQLYRLAFHRSNKVFFLNRDDRDEFLQKRIVQAGQAALLPGPGVDTDYFCPQPVIRSGAEPREFLFVARLLAEKGIREFANAARLVKAGGYRAQFRVLGAIDPGNPTSIQPEELEAWTREGILQYEGFVEDVRPAIAAATVLVLPSYYREGMPRSILEAMSMAKPVITTDNVGCRETVTDGLNGLLTRARDARALADTMIRFLDLSDDQIQEMGRQSRLKVLAEFSDQIVLPQYLQTICAILSV